MGNRKYDEEFKKEAVRLVVEEGQKIRAVERNLGITIGILKDWVAKYRQQNQPPQDRDITTAEKRIRELEKDLARVTREREIFKKAVAIFSKEPNPYSGS